MKALKLKKVEAETLMKSGTLTKKVPGCAIGDLCYVVIGAIGKEEDSPALVEVLAVDEEGLATFRLNAKRTVPGGSFWYKVRMSAAVVGMILLVGCGGSVLTPASVRTGTGVLDFIVSQLPEGEEVTRAREITQEGRDLAREWHDGQEQPEALTAWLDRLTEAGDDPDAEPALLTLVDAILEHSHVELPDSVEVFIDILVQAARLLLTPR